MQSGPISGAGAGDLLTLLTKDQDQWQQHQVLLTAQIPDGMQDRGLT
jgi:hypothetical protein